MSGTQNVEVIDLCDGFNIVVHKKARSFHFDQKDDRTELVKVFELLGFRSPY